MRLPLTTRMAALAALAGLATAACTTDASTEAAAQPAGDASSSSTPAPAGADAGASAGADLPAGWADAADGLRCEDTTVGTFPRTVAHADGTATIESEPTRVVSIEGTSSLDLMLLMGVTPVAAGGDDADGGLLAWQEYLAEKAGVADEIDVIAKRPEVNVEQIVAARPDLIVSQTGWITEIRDELDKLGVPIVTFEWGAADPPVLPEWREITRIVGESVGRDACIDEIVGKVEAAATDAGERIRRAVGADTTFSSFYTFPDYHAMNGALHPTSAFLRDEMGLQVKAPAGKEMAEFSPEKPEILEADLMLAQAFEGTNVRDFSTKPAVEALDGEIVVMPEAPANASYYPSALGLRLFTEWLVRELG